MNCKSCDYPLWNLRTRNCPECGAPFKPSEHEFVANAVRFCCPHCDQAYYGTDDHGHLVPRAFECATCHRPVDMDEMVLRPAQGVRDADTRAEVIPWVDPAGGGIARRWWNTTLRALVAPGRMMPAVHRDAGTGPAWVYALITITLTMIVSLGPFALLPLLIVGAGGAGAGAGLGPIALGLLIWIVGAIVAGAIMLVVSALIAHVVLMITGPSVGPVSRTLSAYLYGTGANVASMVPCLGVYIGWIWWLVSTTILVQTAHGVKAWRAILAVVVVPVASITIIVGLYVALAVAFMSGTFVTGGMTVQGWSPTSTLASAIDTYHTTHGTLPDHGLRLMEDGLVQTMAFSDPTGADPLAPRSVGRWTVADFQTMLPTPRRQAIDELADALPADVVAHRVGDYVFTYHGLDLADPNQRALWVVMLDGPRGAIIHATAADGTNVAFARSTLAPMLAAENARRATCGLPPLPNPATVTDGAPATAGAPTPDPDATPTPIPDLDPDDPGEPDEPGDGGIAP